MKFVGMSNHVIWPELVVCVRNQNSQINTYIRPEIGS